MTTKQKLQTLLFYGTNLLKKQIYLRTGKLIPSPINIYLQTSFRCSARCKMCFIWAQKDPEIPYKYWKTAIDQIIDLSGPAVKINLTGGEVLESKMSYMVLKYIAKKTFMAGFTTNGYFVDRKIAKELIGLNLSNINISLDGVTDKTVNFIRGKDDFYQKTKQGIEYLIDEKNKANSKTKIIIKTLIMAPNLDEVADVARMALKMGVNSIYYQPTNRPLEGNWSDDQFKSSHLWPTENLHPKVNSVMDELIKLKKNGTSMINSVYHLNGVRNYLLGKHINTGLGNCDIDLTTMMFKQRGQIHFCDRYLPIGNIKDLQKKKLSDLIKESRIADLRKVMRTCGKNCLSPCFSKKSMSDYLNIYSNLVGWFG